MWRTCVVWRDMCSVEGHVQCALTLNDQSPSMGAYHALPVEPHWRGEHL